MTNTDLRSTILTDNLWRLMVRLSPIAIVSMSISSINFFVDAVFIGQFLGEKAVAAIALAFPLAFLTNGLAAMIGVGGSSILSRAIGSEDSLTLKKIFGTTTILSILSAGFLIVFGWSIARSVIAMIGGVGEVLEMATAYYKTLVLGAPFHLFAMSANLLIRAEGKIKEAMLMAIFSTLLNMLLNPIFIYYLGLGIEGAAWATIVAMMVFSLLNIWYYATGRASYGVDLSYFGWDKKIVHPLLSIGTSAMMLQMMFVVQQLVVYKMLEIYGTEWDIAFMGACYRILLLLLLPGFGFAVAMQPVAGINFGAGDLWRVKQAFWVFTVSSCILLVVLWGSFQFFPSTVLGWMLPEADFTDLDIWNFQLAIVGSLVFPVFFMTITLLQAIGDAKVAGIFMVLREIVFYIPILIILPIWLGVTGIYAASVVQNVACLLVACFLVWRKFREWELTS